MVFLEGLYVLVFLIVGMFASDENRYSSESEGFSLGGMIRYMPRRRNSSKNWSDSGKGSSSNSERSSLEMERMFNDIVEAESNFPNEFNAMLMVPGTVLNFFNYRDNTRNFQYIKLSSVIHCLPGQIIYQGRIENEEANSIVFVKQYIEYHSILNTSSLTKRFQYLHKSLPETYGESYQVFGAFYVPTGKTVADEFKFLKYNKYDMNEEDLHDAYLCLANVFLSTVQHYTSLGSRVQAENMRLQFLKPKIHVSTLSPLSPYRNTMRMKFKNEQLHEAWKYLQTQSTLIFGKSHVESHYSTFVTEFLRMSLLDNPRSDLEEFNLYNIFNIDYDNIIRHISVLDTEQEKNIFENLQNSILSLNKYFSS